MVWRKGAAVTSIVQQGKSRWCRALCSRAEVGTFWDLNRCAVEDSVLEGHGEGQAVVDASVRSLCSSGFLGPVAISAYGNTRAFNNYRVTHALLTTGVDLQHDSGGWTFGIRRCMVTTADQADSSKSKRSGSSSGRWRWSALFLFIPGISACSLGCWQIMRRKWKMELLDHRRERLKDDVAPLDFATTSAGSDSKQTYSDVLQCLEYRRVQCKGIFQEEKSIFLGPRGRTKHGVTERGYFIISPLIPAEGDDQNVQGPVLVNRGWVPGTWRDNPPQTMVETSANDLDYNQAPAKKGLLTSLWGKKQEIIQKQHVIKETTVVGVVRGSENPNMFVPPNEPASGQWFFVDVPAMAKAVGLPENTIYVEALHDKSSDFKAKQYPDPKDPESLIRSSVMPDDHLSYAFTWFALSAATTFMAWKRLSK